VTSNNHLYVRPTDPFERSGLATLSALGSNTYRELFTALEKEQDRFLEKESRFRSPEYIWPRDPLHCWSRIWEYPYVYFHLKAWRKKQSSRPKVADIGSGVTFFPFAVARLDYEVIAVDVDEITARDLGRAIKEVPATPGLVAYQGSDGKTLPFANGTLDAIYCISVLEHVPEFENLVAEMHRALRPGGLVLLTLDMTLGKEGDIGPDRYERLAESLNGRFVLTCAETPVHPGDMLTTKSSPLPYRRFNPQRIREVFGWRFLWKQLLLPLFSGKSAAIPKAYDLAVQCLVLEKPRA
jgi:SAM-dependent methyltransferase